jgi:F0F1-type ATP synthase assembly protein I
VHNFFLHIEFGNGSEICYSLLKQALSKGILFCTMELPENNLPNKASDNYWREPLAVFARVSAWVAAPVVIALFIGRYLDEKWGSAPWAFLSVTGIAFIISCIGIVRETQKYLSKIEKEHGTNTDDSTSN